MDSFFRERLGDLVCGAALKALMSEVAVSPKPGLVDRCNNGSHADMDFFSFIASAGAILPCFRDCALTGFESQAEPAALFESLRLRGKVAELLMLKASGGVNVHRGAIFCLGVLSAAYGRLYRSGDVTIPKLTALCRAMTETLADDFTGNAAKSHGEAVYARYGLSGIRGEVSAGFPTVMRHSYPELCRLLEQGHSMNDAGLGALFTLLAHTVDTNIIHRSSAAVLEGLQKELRDFLASDPGMGEMREKALELDRRFMAQNISPGGCADLLAVTFFLYELR
jgi:holo-ACP synthase/triphosphoribosyl-dephospho-CoA synthase